MPVLLPPVPGVGSALGRLDGLILTGGGDIDPAGYGAEPDPRTSRVHPERDQAELELLAAAVAFLASDDASFVTAATFLVDGGISSAYVTPQ